MYEDDYAPQQMCTIKMTQSLKIDLKSLEAAINFSFLQNIDYLLGRRRRIKIIFSDSQILFLRINLVEY